MKLVKRLELLERRRDDTLRYANRELSRLKHDARRAVSPRRITRRHPLAALSGAFILGLLIAPGPARESSASRSALRKLLRFITPGIAPKRVPETPPAVPPPRSSLLDRALEALPMLAAQLDWEAIIAAFVTGIRNRHASNGNGHAPDAAPYQPPDAPSAEPASSPPPETTP